MKSVQSPHRLAVLLSLLVLPVLQAFADDYADTVDLSVTPGRPDLCRRGLWLRGVPDCRQRGWFLGGAYGEGRVFALGDYIGDVVMNS